MGKQNPPQKKYLRVKVKNHDRTRSNADHCKGHGGI